MLEASLVKGVGSIPSNVGVGNEVVFTLPDDTPSGMILWNLESKPRGSNAYLNVVNKRYTKLLNIDLEGVYLVKVTPDVNAPNTVSYMSSISVPGDNEHTNIPQTPLYDASDRVRNFSFELEGDYPGYPACWDLFDEDDLLYAHGGVTRGRIDNPANFNVDNGRYVMCIGDDVGIEGFFGIDHEICISQGVDFTGIDLIQLQIKLIKR